MTDYAARLEVDFPESLDRLSTFFRIIWVIPIAVILSLLSPTSETIYINEAGEIIERVRDAGGGLYIATALMILFRRRYPRWWFDFNREFMRFSYRVGAYLLMVTDQYPSTEDEQGVHLEIDYPDAKQDLNRWMPLIKWLLVLPHFLILLLLFPFCLIAAMLAWISVVISGRYPRVIFDFLVGVGRWWLRAVAYSALLITDEYPPFSFN